MGTSRAPIVPHVPTQHQEANKVIGKLKEIHPNGTVTVLYACQKRFSHKKQVTFELAGLEFYTGTDTLLRFSKWGQTDIHEGDEYLLYLGPPSTIRKGDGTSMCEPRTLRLFHENGFGRVDVNRRLQMGINFMLRLELEMGKNQTDDEWIEAGLLRACGNAEIVVGGLWRFVDRMMSFVDEAKLKARQVPEETMETLLARGEKTLVQTLFVVKYPKTGEYRRVLLQSMDKKKRMVEVHYIDTGDVQKIDIHDMYEARKIDLNFANFPHLAFKCHLAGLVSVDFMKLVDTCSGKSLRIRVQRKETQQETEEKKSKVDKPNGPAVHLYMEHEENRNQYYWINEHLVDAGFAVPKVKKEFRHFYAPGWGICES